MAATEQHARELVEPQVTSKAPCMARISIQEPCLTWRDSLQNVRDKPGGVVDHEKSDDQSASGVGLVTPDEDAVFGSQARNGESSRGRGRDPRLSGRKRCREVHQELNLVENLDVSENILLGRPVLKRRAGLRFVHWHRMYKEAAKLMERLRISVDLKTEVSELSVAQKQIIEIAKSLFYSFG